MRKGAEEVCSCLGTILTWPHINALKEEDALRCDGRNLSQVPSVTRMEVSHLSRSHSHEQKADPSEQVLNALDKENLSVTDNMHTGGM